LLFHFQNVFLRIKYLIMKNSMKTYSLFSVFLLLLIFVGQSYNLSAQTDRKAIEYPALQTMLKGVWAKTPNGGPWIKVVISENRYTWYSAQPQSGEWVDWSSQHKNRTLTSFYKVTERSKYDGKPFSYYIAYTDEDDKGFYRAFRIDIESGQQILTVIAKGDKPNYSSSSGRDLNAPIVTEGLKKKPANFNPWQ
jgi:hypothetical protein